MNNDAVQIPADVRARIIEAAEALYEQTGRERLPTVDAVRRAARADMNAVSTVVREWKQQLSARPAPVEVSVPEAVRQASDEALVTVWAVACDLANASLRSAQASWDQEKGDMEAMRRELAQLYEEQERALEESRQAQAAAVQGREKAEQRADELARQLAEAREALARQTALTEQAEARAVEISQHAADLKSELAIAHEDAAAARGELSAARLAHLAELDQVKNVAAEQIERTNEQLATARGRLAEASEQLESRTQGLIELQQQLATATARLEAAEATHAEHKQTVARAASEQAQRFTALQAERDEAVRVSRQDSEERARLQGQVESLQGIVNRLTPNKKA
ncbi:DNA-binding protein [Ectopseudomonas hydrolytica]|uniref:DNA-binding protein n=1 Tax=Ectopseudomonas hydrolytica TaxID=2493633 RepID=UPI0020B7578E|nr:DNA-binding protein [Pseudomonas hydrolytica]UTH34284.1 DNA-binding protein [Pseudomonas hydrolytica]UZZ13597.1 DNA-binding protein [Pseudomonas mendocina]